MKLATYNNNTRDGELILVDRSLTKAVKVASIAPTLQYALDHWNDVVADLEQLYQDLNSGKIAYFPFHSNEVLSPLPRAYQWADGSAYVNHVELVRKARGAEMPENFWTDPLMYQGGSDCFLAPNENIVMHDANWGIDFESEVAVILDDVPMGVTPKAASEKILLIMLVNDVSLRNLMPNELAKSFGFFQSKPSSAFSPVAVTPDELGKSWDGNKINLPLITHLNNQLFGKPNAGVDMTFNFPQLIAHAAKTRKLMAGTIIGSGTVSNIDRSQGSSCIAEKRMLETLADGKPKTPFMNHNDTVRIEMLNDKNESIFGAIEQKVIITS